MSAAAIMMDSDEDDSDHDPMMLKDGLDPHKPQNAAVDPKALETSKDKYQYHLLVSAMERVRAATAKRVCSPPEILKVAGGQLDLVSGDSKTIHLYIGRYHGVVRAGVEQDGNLVGMVDLKDSNKTWEIRMSSMQRGGADPRELADVAQREEALKVCFLFGCGTRISKFIKIHLTL